MAEGIVTRVFVRHRGDKCFREKRSRCLIRERPPIIPAIPGEPVVKLRIRPQSHALASEQSRPKERRIIPAILRRKREFLPDGYQRKFCVGAHSRKIWNDPKHALGLLAFEIIYLLVAWSWIRRRRSRSRCLGPWLGSGVQLRCGISGASRLLVLLLMRGAARLVWNSFLRPDESRKHKKK